MHTGPDDPDFSNTAGQLTMLYVDSKTWKTPSLLQRAAEAPGTFGNHQTFIDYSKDYSSPM
jgi:hypothetical protein